MQYVVRLSLVFMGLLLFSCGNGLRSPGNGKHDDVFDTTGAGAGDIGGDTASAGSEGGEPVAAGSLARDTVQLAETFNQEDIPANEYLAARLRPIRENFKRINTTTRWTAIDSLDLWESTEGGVAKFYYQHGQLEKIITRHYGETFQQLTEYYLLKGQLSFVLERSYKYNRPIYYDSTAMKANNDTAAFDFDASEIVEDRSYFENGTLLHQVNNQDCGAPFADDYLREEQKRIKGEFERVRRGR